MISRLAALYRSHPRQFWILFWGGLVSSAGGSMVWPFLSLYVRERLQLPLTTVGVVLGLSSLAGLITQPVAGSLVDRFGRRGVLLLSLAAGSITSLGFILTSSLEAYVVLSLLSGASWPVGVVASYAMVTDLVPSAKRTQAAALLRIAHNVGFAAGPAAGGFLAASSFNYSFGTAALASFLILLLYGAFIRETMPTKAPEGEATPGAGGYYRVLRDLPFLSFSLGYALLGIAYLPVLSLLVVTLKEVHGIPESSYGLLMTTNGAMVVLFQLSVTRFTDRFPRLPVMAAGSLLVAVGSGSVAYLSSFPMFWLATVVYTIGELFFVPTAFAIVADLAPVELRGRYMAVYGLSWGLSRAVGPAMVGGLNDLWGPAALWQGTLILGLLAAGMFWAMGLRVKLRAAEALPAIAPREEAR